MKVAVLASSIGMVMVGAVGAHAAPTPATTPGVESRAVDRLDMRDSSQFDPDPRPELEPSGPAGDAPASAHDERFDGEMDRLRRDAGRHGTVPGSSFDTRAPLGVDRGTQPGAASPSAAQPDSSR